MVVSKVLFSKVFSRVVVFKKTGRAFGDLVSERFSQKKKKKTTSDRPMQHTKVLLLAQKGSETLCWVR